MRAPAPEPILHYALDVVPQGADRFGAWREAGLYWVWSGAAGAQDPPWSVLEKVDKGVVDFPARGYLMHPILAGKIHHVSRLFGYWHESDADRIWLQFPRGETSVYALIWGGKSGVHRQDRLLWFCPRCGERIAERLIDTAKSGLEGFIAAQLEAARAFNFSAEKRTCKNCGFVHPEAYGFYPRDDTAAEKAARELW